MSFYDDASLIWIAEGAGGGYDDWAPSIKPVPELSTHEELTDADLPGSNPASWFRGGGCTIANGKATWDGSQGGQSNLHNASGNSLENGKLYRVQYTVSDYTNGAIRVKAGNTGTGRRVAANGTYVELLRAAVSTFPTVQWNATANFVGSISNLSCKEVFNNSDFDFARAADLSATRINKDGVIEKCTKNLLSSSNSLTTSGSGWSGTSSNPINYNNSIAGQPGYDGKNNAFLIEKTTNANSYIGVPHNIDHDGLFTWSAYFKNEGSKDNGVYMFTPVTAAYFDLVNGQILGGSGTNQIGKHIEDVGNGWYRCSVTGLGRIDPSDPNDRPRFKPTNITGDNPGTGAYNDTGKIFAQDFQIEVATAATPPVVTGSRLEDGGEVVSGLGGVLGDQPRFDYKRTGGPAILGEPKRINKIPHSEYFGTWTAQESEVFSNNIKSPEGVLNGTKFRATSGSSNLNHQINSPAFTVKGTAVTASVFAKKGNVDFIRLRLNGTANSDNSHQNPRAWFDLENGTTGTVDAGGTSSIVDMGDGWYRCILTFSGNVSTSVSLQLFINKIDAQTSWTSNGSEYIYIYGAQYEDAFSSNTANYVTSYIPTFGAEVTRNADAITLPLADSSGVKSLDLVDRGLITKESGTFFVDFEDWSTTAVQWSIESFDIKDAFRVYAHNATALQILHKNERDGNGQTTLMTFTGLPSFGRRKVAISWSGNNVIASVNGSHQTATCYDNVAQGLEQIERSNNSGTKVNTRAILLFPNQLSAAELNELTTI
jgi:hypothetical protein